MQVNLGRFVLMILLVLFALHVLTSALLSNTSALGQVYLYGGVVCFIMGAMAPRVAFVGLMFCSGYIDLFKRLMVVYGRPTQTDLYWINGIPPLLMAGILISVFLGMFTGKTPITKWLLIPLGVSVAWFGLGLTSDEVGGFGRNLSAIVNQGAYIFLVFVVPVLFPTDDQKRKLLNWMFIIFIPVALYMYRHRFFGLADFEYRYLLTGLTIESRILVENNGALRGFSTMSSAGVVSNMLSTVMLLCFIPMAPPGQVVTPMRRLGKLLLFPVLAMASYYTVVRGGWVCGLVTFGVYIMLGSQVRALLGYTFGVAAVALLILAAPWMQQTHALEKAEEFLMESLLTRKSDAYANRALVLGTASDRVNGWANLTQSGKLYTPFGFKAAGMDIRELQHYELGHDFIIHLLVTVGYVPLLIVVPMVIWLFFRANQFYFQLPRNSSARKICRICLALSLGMAAGCLGSSSNLRVWPQNFYFYLWISFIFSSFLTHRKALAEAKLKARALAAQQKARAEGAGGGMLPAPQGLALR